jgi:sigma-B regulation protein RsbU (phosphoserine phosphatase)
MNTELNLAERIQAGMLPRVFPAFPERGEFDIYASMDPAREVGGDLYDFFLIDEDHLCLQIGDVSGKGIPAALFMMAVKILLENGVKGGHSPAQILAEVNNAICANNPEDMFITVWLGILEISTGKLTAVNAGHEYPVLRQPSGSYELLKDKHGFVVGSMENLKFREYELKLEPGASIFVYTDGLPEAMDEGNNMFGTGRMLDALNTEPDAAPQRTLENVRTAVDDFVKGAEQFDDLTMLCMQYRGAKQSGQS